ncbi:MAG: hypothetical protein LBP22_02280 [Deltaproteobacteria bacterium]|jgi:hypothetical protein|nr:hypothetical protein [Deltaproteobacteria bacterium]
MFSHLATISKGEERPEIFSLLMVGLGILAHLLVLVGLALAATAVLDIPFLQRAQTLFQVLAMVLTVEVLRLPIVLARSQVRAAFGLDLRTTGTRFFSILKKEVFFTASVWLLSYALLSLLHRIDLIVWAVILFLGVQARVFGQWFYKYMERKLFPRRFRPAAGAELPDGLGQLLNSLPLPGDFRLTGVYVYLGRTFGLPWPYIIKQEIIIPREALSLSAGVLKHRLVVTVLGRLVKADGLIMVLKVLTASLTVPLALVFLGSLGYLWPFPSDSQLPPALLSCIWLAAAVSFWISGVMVRLVRRLLERKLAAAAVLATWDVPAFQASLEAASKLDLEPDGNPWWFWFSRNRPGAVEQIEQVKSQLQILTKPRPATPAGDGHGESEPQTQAPYGHQKPLGGNGRMEVEPEQH